MKTVNKTWTLGTSEIVNKIRIYADDGKAITNNGIDLYGCVDVDSIDGWYEVDAPVPEDEEATAEEALEIISGGADDDSQ